MNKILLFLGSPRKNGISAALAQQVAAGAASVGAEIITYNLNDDSIKGCQGCNYCRSHEGCATKDGMASVFEQMHEVNGMIAAFPIYFNAVSAQSKKLIDRSCAFVDGNYAPRYSGIKFVTVYSQLAEDPKFYQQMIADTNQLFVDEGFELSDTLLGYGLKTAKQIPSELMEQAFEAGKKLAM